MPLMTLQNAAAYVPTRISKTDHKSPVLVSPNWLPVKIQNRVLLLTFPLTARQPFISLNSLSPISQTRHAPKTQAHWNSLDFSESCLEPEPLAIRLLFGGSSSRL